MMRDRYKIARPAAGMLAAAFLVMIAPVSLHGQQALPEAATLGDVVTPPHPPRLSRGTLSPGGGEGREVKGAFAPGTAEAVPLRGSASDFAAWQERFSARLDGSIAKLRAERDQKRNGAVEVTWGRAGGTDNEPAFIESLAKPAMENRLPHLAGILRENGLPPSLMGVVAVESAFNPLALSPKGARGLWQLMPDTARRYGLRVEWNDDERTNPLKSTRAAAAYIKDLFAQFRDWPLTLAAYNAGEDRVARAMTRTGARDFWTLRRRGALPEETLQYVPAVLEKFEGPLDAPETESSFSAAASSQSKSPAGRIAYATPAGHE